MAGGGMGASQSNVGNVSAEAKPGVPSGVASNIEQMPTMGLPVASSQALQAPAQQVSPMIQQMQSQAQMQNPYARPMPQQMQPQQQMYRPQMMQQPMARPPMAQQQQYGGLQSLLNSLITRYQQPQQRFSQMPRYQNPGLSYRPDLSKAQEALNRTATTKAEAQAAAEAAARAKLEAEMGVSGEDADFLRWQRQQYEASRNSFNSGG